MTRAGVPLLFAVVAIFSMGAPARADSPTRKEVRARRSFDVHGTTWRLARVVDTAPMPWSVLDVPDEGSLYVAHVGVGKRHRDNVWRYDRESFEVRARASFRGHGVELAAVNGQLLVSNSRDDKLVTLDLETLAVLRSISVGAIPKDFIADDRGEHVFMALWGAGGVESLTLPSGRRTRVRTGKKTRGIALSPDGALLVAMNFGADSISFLRPDPMREIGELALCDAPRHGVFNAAGTRLLVTCHNSDELVVVDPDEREVVRRYPVAEGPKTVALTPDGRAVVAGEDAHAISVVDLESERVSTFPVPARKPCRVYVAPAGDRVYVTAQGSNQLLVFSRRQSE